MFYEIGSNKKPTRTVGLDGSALRLRFEPRIFTLICFGFARAARSSEDQREK
jgi:hypothetical protein